MTASDTGELQNQLVWVAASIVELFAYSLHSPSCHLAQRIFLLDSLHVGMSLVLTLM
jgi:hypothetical protein